MSLPIPSDPELEWWAALREGSEVALERLIRTYTRPLMAYGRKMIPDDDLIQDCIQEVFIQLWQYRATLRSENLSVRGYLFTALRRRVVTELKSQRWTQPRLNDGDEPFDVAFSVEERLIESESERQRVALINQHVNQLPRRQKEALFLKYHQDFTNQQVAEVMGIKYQTATNLLFEALSTLRRVLPDQALWLYLPFLLQVLS